MQYLEKLKYKWSLNVQKYIACDIPTPVPDNKMLVLVRFTLAINRQTIHGPMTFDTICSARSVRRAREEASCGVILTISQSRRPANQALCVYFILGWGSGRDASNYWSNFVIFLVRNLKPTEIQWLSKVTTQNLNSKFFSNVNLYYWWHNLFLNPNPRAYP